MKTKSKYMNTKDTRATFAIASEGRPTEPQFYSLVRKDKLDR